MTNFRFSKINELVDSIDGSIAQLAVSFDKVIDSQQKLSVYDPLVHGGSAEAKLHAVCPTTGELVLLIDADVRRLVTYDLPQAFKKLKAAHLAPGDTNCDEVSIYGFEGCAAILVHLKYCNMHQTGELTNHNASSQFQKNIVETKGKIARVLQAVGVPELHEAPHWPKNDLASAAFLTQWMETSMLMLELHHYLVYSLHTERFLARGTMLPFAKGSCSAQVREKLEDLFKNSQRYTELYGKGKGKLKWKGDSDVASGKHVAEFVEADFDNIVNSLATMGAKTRAISTPFSISRNMESCLNLKSPVHFNRSEGRKREELEAAWEPVWQYYMLEYHKAQQYRGADEGGAYPLKGRPWNLETFDAIQAMQQGNPGEFNPAAWAAIHDPTYGAIANGVLPDGNNTVRLLDPSGRDLQSPKGSHLTTFEAACAYGVLCNTKYKRGMGDDAIVLISFEIGERAKSVNRVSVYYGNMRTIQPVLPARFVHDVLNGEYGSWHKTKAGQPTPAPTLASPFTNVKALMQDWTRIGSASTEKATDRAFQKRHSAFESYDDPAEENGGSSPPKRARIGTEDSSMMMPPPSTAIDEYAETM